MEGEACFPFFALRDESSPHPPGPSCLFYHFCVGFFRRQKQSLTKQKGGKKLETLFHLFFPHHFITNESDWDYVQKETLHLPFCSGRTYLIHFFWLPWGFRYTRVFFFIFFFVNIIRNCSHDATRTIMVNQQEKKKKNKCISAFRIYMERRKNKEEIKNDDLFWTPTHVVSTLSFARFGFVGRRSLLLGVTFFFWINYFLWFLSARFFIFEVSLFLMRSRE